MLFSSLEQLAARRGWKRILLGSDNYFAWLREHPNVRVSPDVYLIDEPPPPPIPKMWKTWLPGHHPPRWALEIVSDDWRKDYEQGPRKYEALGCKELVLFDPDAILGNTYQLARVPLTVYRRDRRGALVKRYSGNGPAFSVELGVWLVARLDGYEARLRLSEDEEGTRLIPTADERAAEAEKKLERIRARRPADRRKRRKKPQ